MTSGVVCANCGRRILYWNHPTRKRKTATTATVISFCDSACERHYDEKRDTSDELVRKTCGGMR